MLCRIVADREDVSSDASLAVLCRTFEQLEAAVASNVSMVYADFHDVREYGRAIEVAHDAGVLIGVATIRMQKPGETGLIRVLGRHRPDLILARNLAAIDFFGKEGVPVVADFSMNVANHRAAEWLRECGVLRVTASYDLNRDQLMDLVGSVPSTWLEVVIHQHVPMFHMEHCVFCAVLSPGTNKTNCGRPCDRHVVQLRDRVGAMHTLQADVACRNTLYNATAQSGAECVSELMRSGVGWFRVELLEETPAQARASIASYHQLLAGELSGQEVWQRLRATNRLGVTRGTLEAKRNPLEIL
jgi:putative protease